jgi:hypothetical protein
MRRRSIVLGGLALVLGARLPARAGEIRDFDPKAFADAQAAGRSTIVNVFAPW